MTLGWTPVGAARHEEDPRDRLAALGHELKTPLSIILGLCARLEAGGRLDPHDTADVDRIIANAHTMLRQVQEMMLVARMENGHIELAPSLADVATLVRSCADGLRELADERRVEIDVVAPPRMAAIVDRDKVTSALTNLIANGIAHARMGGHVLCAVRAQPGALVIDVSDDGPGVPIEERAVIFHRFHTRSSGGTGLGLALVREIAALHGGTVTVGDADMGGALFRLRLPLRAPRREVAADRRHEYAQ